MLYDVVIAGAGPVGLFLSCELAQAGCSVLVLEQLSVLALVLVSARLQAIQELELLSAPS